MSSALSTGARRSGSTGNETHRQLKIKLGIVKRLGKEVAAYERDVQQQEQKIAKMKTDERDPYDVRKQEEVLQECYMMVPDSKARHQAALEDLQNFLAENLEDEDLQRAAAELLDEARQLVKPQAAVEA